MVARADVAGPLRSSLGCMVGVATNLVMVNATKDKATKAVIVFNSTHEANTARGNPCPDGAPSPLAGGSSASRRQLAGASSGRGLAYRPVQYGAASSLVASVLERVSGAMRLAGAAAGVASAPVAAGSLEASWTEVRYGGARYLINAAWDLSFLDDHPSSITQAEPVSAADAAAHVLHRLLRAMSRQDRTLQDSGNSSNSTNTTDPGGPAEEGCDVIIQIEVPPPTPEEMAAAAAAAANDPEANATFRAGNTGNGNVEKRYNFQKAIAARVAMRLQAAVTFAPDGSSASPFNLLTALSSFLQLLSNVTGLPVSSFKPSVPPGAIRIQVPSLAPRPWMTPSSSPIPLPPVAEEGMATGTLIGIAVGATGGIALIAGLAYMNYARVAKEGGKGKQVVTKRNPLNKGSSNRGIGGAAGALNAMGDDTMGFQSNPMMKDKLEAEDAAREAAEQAAAAAAGAKSSTKYNPFSFMSGGSHSGTAPAAAAGDSGSGANASAASASAGEPTVIPIAFEGELGFANPLMNARQSAAAAASAAKRSSALASFHPSGVEATRSGAGGGGLQDITGIDDDSDTELPGGSAVSTSASSSDGPLSRRLRGLRPGRLTPVVPPLQMPGSSNRGRSARQAAPLSSRDRSAGGSLSSRVGIFASPSAGAAAAAAAAGLSALSHFILPGENSAASTARSMNSEGEGESEGEGGIVMNTNPLAAARPALSKERVAQTAAAATASALAAGFSVPGSLTRTRKDVAPPTGKKSTAASTVSPPRTPAPGRAAARGGRRGSLDAGGVTITDASAARNSVASNPLRINLPGRLQGAPLASPTMPGAVSRAGPEYLKPAPGSPTAAVAAAARRRSQAWAPRSLSPGDGDDDSSPDRTPSGADVGPGLTMGVQVPVVKASRGVRPPAGNKKPAPAAAADAEGYGRSTSSAPNVARLAAQKAAVTGAAPPTSASVAAAFGLQLKRAAPVRPKPGSGVQVSPSAATPVARAASPPRVTPVASSASVAAAAAAAMGGGRAGRRASIVIPTLTSPASPLASSSSPSGALPTRAQAPVARGGRRGSIEMSSSSAVAAAAAASMMRPSTASTIATAGSNTPGLHAASAAARAAAQPVNSMSSLIAAASIYAPSHAAAASVLHGAGAASKRRSSVTTVDVRPTAPRRDGSSTPISPISPLPARAPVRPAAPRSDRSPARVGGGAGSSAAAAPVMTSASAAMAAAAAMNRMGGSVPAAAALRRATVKPPSTPKPNAK